MQVLPQTQIRGRTGRSEGRFLRRKAGVEDRGTSYRRSEDLD
jgi:hypothetical protein